ncbi:hypothetical protein ACFV6G_35665 [Streptomyces lavendulae]|uniref:hypothetical protein n=1 Tax=Streptomyces lavendulae TaxID=1914 RepID=UPI003687829F
MARTRRRYRAKPASACPAQSQRSRRNKTIRNGNLIGKAVFGTCLVLAFCGFLLIFEPFVLQVTVLPGAAAAFGTGLGTGLAGAVGAVISGKRVRRMKS